MSEPTIWDIAMGGNPPEKFVPYAEYAQLKAEVQTLRHQAVHDVSQLGEQSAEIANLKAEVERLRKAGDEMQKSMLECGPNEMATAFHYDEWWVSYYGWLAAKEGKQS